MKKALINKWSFLAIAIVAFVFQINIAKAGEPWTGSQLMEPAELNKILNNPKLPQPIIYSIGYQAVIKNSINIGAGGNKETIKKLRKLLSKLPKDSKIVVYCGCCPFGPCPNIRPVFLLLNEMGFKNHKLLNLAHNIKVDWIDKGYAVKK